MRLLLPILLILSIFHSTAFAVDDVKCSDKVEFDSFHVPYSNNSSSDTNPMSHNEQSCFENHCHACHCTLVGIHEVESFIQKTLLPLTFNSVFYPKGFALEILRPPIV